MEKASAEGLGPRAQHRRWIDWLQADGHAPSDLITIALPAPSLARPSLSRQKRDKPDDWPLARTATGVSIPEIATLAIFGLDGLHPSMLSFSGPDLVLPRGRALLVLMALREVAKATRRSASIDQGGDTIQIAWKVGSHLKVSWLTASSAALDLDVDTKRLLSACGLRLATRPRAEGIQTTVTLAMEPRRA